MKPTILLLIILAPLLALQAGESLRSVAELWADFDPCNDPIEVEGIRERKENAGVFRHVRYLIGTFKGKPARMTAIYGFPEGTKENLLAVVGIQGGGQRALVSPDGKQPQWNRPSAEFVRLDWK
ncbi:MAG: hypothetical protein NTV93_20135 [Verrucomicrobia bacterium]|nr:hypothetical protein [Verrucomicrobiota bacterium]